LFSSIFVIFGFLITNLFNNHSFNNHAKLTDLFYFLIYPLVMAAYFFIAPAHYVINELHIM